MSSSDFVHFVNPGEGLRTHRFDGYLSFLTDPQYHARDAAITHRYFAHDSGYIFEWKDEIQRETSRIELKPDAPCLWVVIALIGDCTVHVDGVSTVASGNSTCFVSTGRELTLSLSPGKNWLFVIGFPQPCFDALGAEFPSLGWLKPWLEGDTQHGIGEERPISSRLRSILESLRRLVFRPYSTPIQLAGWSLRLLSYFFGDAPGNHTDTVEKDDISHYHQATKFIREHYLDDISLDKVAEALHISVRNLTRSFENRAYTVNGYILHLRLTKAREVLAFSERPIRDIAYTLRFSCPKHFSKMFKQKFRKPPMAYRNEMKKEKLGLGNVAFRNR
ncbi:helix-turn-helix transcriptional regulator [Parapedobacter sp. 10938]|uniref:helix-turn-helix transcriptional regulator n=1 Tax=Parapedobacter flavus TaxID=3110225 RepID=UPI002DB9A34D|nr:AraC family transcriptional regulator [Parapedobacter sp. 10938]MEC3880884.1 AraC family transcriptional regulator [Parapedobacter sp. 10938]